MKRDSGNSGEIWDRPILRTSKGLAPITSPKNTMLRTQLSQRPSDADRPHFAMISGMLRAYITTRLQNHVSIKPGFDSYKVPRNWNPSDSVIPSASVTLHPS